MYIYVCIHMDILLMYGKCKLPNLHMYVHTYLHTYIRMHVHTCINLYKLYVLLQHTHIHMQIQYIQEIRTYQLLHSQPHLLHGSLGVLCGLVHGQLREDLLHHRVLQLVLLQGLSFDQCPQSLQLISLQSTIL